MFTIQNGKLRSLFDEKMSNMRRQDLPKTYIVNGAIYIFPLVLFEKHNTFPSNDSVPYLMKKEESIDVDNENDLKAVKNIMLQNIKNMIYPEFKILDRPVGYLYDPLIIAELGINHGGSLEIAKNGKFSGRYSRCRCY